MEYIRRYHCWFGNIILLLVHTIPVIGQPFSAYVAEMDRIEVDGDLGDWPEAAEWYVVYENAQVYGETDIDDVVLAGSEDLDPRFKIGYNSKENLLYVGLVVRDDSLTVGGGDPWSSDACEVYVSVDRENPEDEESAAVVSADSAVAGSLAPVLQYVAIPGLGSYDDSGDNPVLIMGDIARTNTQVAHRRTGGVTVYEWAIELFDAYPYAPAELFRGQRILFDIAVVDKDGLDDLPAWVTWAYCKPLKRENVGSLGVVYLREDDKP